MFGTIKRLLIAALVALPVMAITSQSASADPDDRPRRGFDRHERYWNGHWRWYDRRYRPYWHHRGYRGSRGSDDGFRFYYGPRRSYGYGRPYRGYNYGPGYGRSGVEVGPLRFYWR